MARLLEPGDRLDRWVVVERYLGGWGVVYGLRDLRWQGDDARPQLVMGKTIRPEFAEDAQRVARFEEESYVWLSLGLHKNIVRLFSVDRFHGQAFAIGEYIPQTGLPSTLRGWLNHNLIELESGLRFGVHICHALSFARSRGLAVHQDLKPENVMVTSAGVAKVTDWGLSRMVPPEVAAPVVVGDAPYRYPAEGETSPTTAHGTRGYAAPELGLPEAVATPRADLFSLAVVLAEMLSGRRQDAGTRAQDLESWLRPLCSRVRRGLADVLAACLSQRPGDRPESPTDLVFAMQAAFEELVGVPLEEDMGVAFEAASDLGQRAYGLFMLGRLDEAMKVQAEVVRRYENEEASDKPPTLVMMMDYKERGWTAVLPAELLDQAEEKVRADPGNPAHLDEASGLNLMAGRRDRALQLCLAWLQLVGEDPEVLRRTARILSEQGRRQDALSYVDRAIAREPTSDLWLMRSDLCEPEGDRAGALRSAERAVELDEENVEALIRHGHLLAETGDHAGAESRFRAATVLDPQNRMAWFDLGTSLFKLERLGEAFGALSKAVEVDPEFAIALNTLGVLARHARTEQEATAFFQRAIAADPRYPRPWFNLGQVYEATHQIDKARDAYQRSLELDPAHAMARNALEQLDAAHS